MNRIIIKENFSFICFHEDDDDDKNRTRQKINELKMCVCRKKK